MKVFWIIIHDSPNYPDYQLPNSSFHSMEDSDNSNVSPGEDMPLKCHRNFWASHFLLSVKRIWCIEGKIFWISRNSFLATCFLGSPDCPWGRRCTSDLHNLHQVFLWEGSVMNMQKGNRILVWKKPIEVCHPQSSPSREDTVPLVWSEPSCMIRSNHILIMNIFKDKGRTQILVDGKKGLQDGWQASSPRGRQPPLSRLTLACHQNLNLPCLKSSSSPTLLLSFS